jgi:hypothetical protein
MQARDAYIALNLFEGIGPVRVRALLDVLGSPARIFEAGLDELLQAKGVGRGVAESLIAQRAKVDVAAEIRRAADVGASIVTQADPEYPAALKHIHDPPLALYVRGRFDPKDAHAIAVVGSRRCTHYGTSVADRLSFQLAKQGYTVVSGLALGIDAAAHQGALKGGGRTIAVQGCGIDQVYPSEHKKAGRGDRRAGGGHHRIPGRLQTLAAKFSAAEPHRFGPFEGHFGRGGRQGIGGPANRGRGERAGAAGVRGAGPHRQSQRQRQQLPDQTRGQAG